MTGAVAPFPAPVSPLGRKLTEALRPEFSVPVIPLDVRSPVFARGVCRVAGCDRGAWSRLLCSAHYQRWSDQGKPDVDTFAAGASAIRAQPGALVDTLDLRSLPLQARLEVAWIVQRRHDDRGVRLLPYTVRHLVELFTETGVDSLLDWPPEQWIEALRAKGRVDPSRTIGLIRYAYRHLMDLVEGTDPEAEFARDVWRAEVLGMPQHRSPNQIRFALVSQPWLRAPVKRWARFRLGAGKSFGTVHIDVRALGWFSRFITEVHPDVTGAAGLTRDEIEGYLAWLAAASLAGHTRNTYLVCLRGFLDACRRHGWMPGLPAKAAIYLDELPRRPQPLPRFVPDFVMAQLEDPVNLGLLPDDTTRHLLVVIMETGLRANDACALEFNPIIEDSSGWPCLRYHNRKMAVEQLVPLSAKAADAIRAQQAQLRAAWPAGPPPRLFPSAYANPDGVRPFSYATLRQRLTTWQENIGLHDEASQAVQVTAHQFRHTLGTRLINHGVPQHVVQKMLGHATPQMTARYATIHDATVRAAFDDYQRRRVDITGSRLDFDPEAPTADAEWVKHNLARVQASLPNGYCGRPPQQDCPHPNACLTCPDFQTTPQFLAVHRRQRDENRALLTAAEHNGRTRLVANHRQVEANLERIIRALETIDNDETEDDSQ